MCWVAQLKAERMCGMKYQVGDKVFHPTYGVGHIATVEKRKILGNVSRLYYEIAAQRSTVWVPVDAQETIGLRLLTTKRDLARLRALLKSRPNALTDNHGRRHLAIANRLDRKSNRLHSSHSPI